MTVPTPIRPRDYMAAMLGESLAPGDFGIWINAHRIGGSIVRVTPAQARKIGRRLIEMADWLDARKMRSKP